MNSLKIIGKNIHLNGAELEWLKAMRRLYGCTEQEALKEIIEYKREQAFGYEKIGNFELARQLLQEVDEWDDSRESDYKQRVKIKDIKIILPGR